MTDYAKLTDRELDATVAEKVFGHEIGFQGKEPGIVRHKVEGDWETWSSLPRFSTDVSAAFLVVEEMRTKQGCAAVLCSPVDRGTKWDVTIGDHDRVAFHGQASDPSLPRAICLAALRAVGSK